MQMGVMVFLHLCPLQYVNLKLHPRVQTIVMVYISHTDLSFFPPHCTSTVFTIIGSALAFEQETHANKMIASFYKVLSQVDEY